MHDQLVKLKSKIKKNKFNQDLDQNNTQLVSPIIKQDELKNDVNRSKD